MTSAGEETASEGSISRVTFSLESLSWLSVDGNTATDSNADTFADTDPGLLTFHEHRGRGHGAEEEGVVLRHERADTQAIGTEAERGCQRGTVGQWVSGYGDCGSASDRAITVRSALLGRDGLFLRSKCVTGIVGRLTLCSSRIPLSPSARH